MQPDTKLQQQLKQKISPQQIQYLQLLSCNHTDLEGKINKEVEENVALIEKEEKSQTKEPKEVSVTNTSLFDQRGKSDQTLRYTHTLKVQKPWRESLEDQLHLLQLSPSMQTIGEHLIGSLEEDGYLRTDLEVLSSEIAVLYNLEVTVKELQIALHHIQQLEPTGVGARNLQESLLLQLQKKEPKEVIRQAIDVITYHFTLFTKRDYQTIMKKINITASMFGKVIAEIRKLYPEPTLLGSSQQKATMLQADFVLKKAGNQLVIEIPYNRAATLRVHDDYLRLIQAYQDAREQDKKKAMLFIQRSIKRAEHFIEALKQRHQTLLAVMKAILKLQHNFFKEEDEKQLLPMYLRDIAHIVKVDESTISRAITNKSLQTEQQIYPLKFFFSEGIKTQEGRLVSSRKVKKVLIEIIEKEDKKKPYPDEQLTKLLQQKGFLIARRTVAKYRSQLRIAPARLRKELES
ncbi:MAG: RNA polymerase factor sigma-54 [Bacteroidota bacterium]